MDCLGTKTFYIELAAAKAEIAAAYASATTEKFDNDSEKDGTEINTETTKDVQAAIKTMDDAAKNFIEEVNESVARMKEDDESTTHVVDNEG